MDPRRHLYTRQQIQTLTGADESTLNFWARENIIKPTSGGGGKGQHRRYGFEQVNLTAILLRFKRFGVSIQSLREIATIFHDAVSYTRGLGLTDDEDSALSMLIYFRRVFLRDGFVEILVEGKPWRNKEIARRLHHGHAGYIQLNWAEFLEHACELEAHTSYTERLVKLVEQTDLDVLSWNGFVSNIVQMVTEKKYSGSEAEYYYRDEKGCWTITSEPNADTADSFIAIDATRISYETWVLNAAKLQLGADQ